MHDLVRPVRADDVEHPGLVADRAELDGARRLPPSPTAKRGLRDEAADVEDDHGAAGIEQRTHEVAADEAGPAGHDRRPLADRPRSRPVAPMSISGRAIPCS